MGKVCSFLWACDSIKNFSQGKVIGIRIWEFCCDNIQPNLFTNNHFNTEQTNSQIFPLSAFILPLETVLLITKKRLLQYLRYQ